MSVVGEVDIIRGRVSRESIGGKEEGVSGGLHQEESVRGRVTGQNIRKRASKAE